MCASHETYAATQTALGRQSGMADLSVRLPGEVEWMLYLFFGRVAGVGCF
ncbi:hypothetical protein CA85_16500 [Allorhodopirellula solitaria]|uniref:Uncharacterized protein n=1 Tax=Allorhodopirellula solitaria TaxID=2527987 RepID=A0A5C5YED3_9BACT|nr:hypothetical protein CA85_16500 [Allorhodopirellula solitaria]